MSQSNGRRSKNKDLREREDLIRRSPILDSNAKILWIELARGWAWNDRSCSPSQNTLARALGWTIRTLRRHLATLTYHQLLTVERASNCANRYVLPDKIPPHVCDPSRLINKNLAEEGRQRTDLSSRKKGKKRTKSSSAKGQNCPPVEDRIDLCQRSKVSSEDELLEDELSEDELSEELRAQKRSRSSSGPNEGKETQEVQEVQEAEDLLEETAAELSEKRPRKPRLRARRHCDNSFVPKTGEMSGKPPSAPWELVSASPPPPESAQDLLNIFAEEIRLKYGTAAYKTMELSPSITEKKKLENGILANRDPALVISMIRVLVWDWEVIREKCWPPNKALRYPRLIHLLVYKDALASAVPCGFEYTGNLRGSHSGYAARYLFDGKIIDDPF